MGTLFGTGGSFCMIHVTLRGLDKSTLRASFAAPGLLVGGRVHVGLRPIAITYFISLLLVFSGYQLLAG